jgi:hypothetical protein
LRAVAQDQAAAILRWRAGKLLESSGAFAHYPPACS